MEIAEIRQYCEQVLANENLNTLEKVKSIDNVIKGHFNNRSNAAIDLSPTENVSDDKADPLNSKLPTYGVSKEETGEAELLTDLANSIRKLVREDAWGGENPISFKEAVKINDLLEDDDWDMLENWIDHDRDYNWNYINLIQFNLKFNKKDDGSGFWLSPQHFRMLAILDMASREAEAGNGLDFDLVKKTYQSKDQIPKSISSSLATLRHKS